MEWITTHNVEHEVWRRLLEYANDEIVYEKLEDKHGTATSARVKANYKKQARQIRVALLQAKEYFDIAQTSNITTKPNHLFYGMTSLSTAVMLFLGDGNKSLDVLRNNKSNLSHGLQFTTGANAATSKNGLTLLNESYVKILPNGFFKNWYETLPSQKKVTAKTEVYRNNHTFTGLQEIGHEAAPDFPSIINSRKTLLSVAQHIPDLYFDLNRYNHNVVAARGNHKYITNEDTNKKQHVWNIHSSITHDNLLKISSKFTTAAESNNYFTWGFEDGASSGSISIIEKGFTSFSYPSSRETLEHETIYYYDDIIQHEIVDSFIIGFGLSMLSRYYPDIWISSIEGHCKAIKITERLMDILIRKFPMISLSYLSGQTTIVSNNKPY